MIYVTLLYMSKAPLILGIDPGTQILGYAILKGGPKPSLITMDVLNLTKEKDIYARLQMIHARIIELIETYLAPLGRPLAASLYSPPSS